MSEESISVSQYFVCPVCQHDIVEEIIYNVTQASCLTDIHMILNYDNTRMLAEAEYNQYKTDGGDMDRYQCHNCGWTIKSEDGIPIDNLEDLFEWLKQHKEKREKELNTP